MHPPQNRTGDAFGMGGDVFRTGGVRLLARLLIADPYPIVRCGLRSMIDERDGWTIVGEAVAIEDLAGLALSTRPDIIIVDPSSFPGDLCGILGQIRALLHDTEILVFTAEEDEKSIRELVTVGARGYVLKTDGGEHILAAVEALLDHRPYFTWQVSATLLNGLSEAPIEVVGSTARALTRRESEVVKLIAAGLSNRRIAEHLSVSIKTVEAHRTMAMRKIRANSTADVVRYAVRHHMIEA